MRIRTQLVIAFLALAIVPLVVIVGWSYASSSRAVTRAVLEEATLSTRHIETRLQAARARLTRRFTALEADDVSAMDSAPRIARQFGEMAPLVESVIILPAAPPEPADAPAPPPGPAPGDAPEPPLAPIDSEAIARAAKTAADAAIRSAGVTIDVRQLEVALERAQTQAAEEAIREAANAHRRLARERTRLVLGHELRKTLEDGREVVADVRPEGFLRTVLVPAAESDDIPFAVDNEGKLYTTDQTSEQRLAELPLQHTGEAEIARRVAGDWVIVTSRDPESGLTYGIAHPIRESLAQVKRTAATNLGVGLGMIGFSLLIIIPIANHLTRDLEQVTEGARRVARGDLDTTVPVRSNNEVGQLAIAFNTMARELESNQQRLIEQEQLRMEQEVQQRLLVADHERKTSELEEARRFQLSLLPRELPRHPQLDVAVHMETATEVGGDYYDFVASGQDLVVAIGDATGHGATAGTMVTVVKSLFAAHADALEPAAFLLEADRAIRRMDLGRMAMAMALCRLSPGKLTYASAGMPPLLCFRAETAQVEEHLISGTPLGTLGGERDQRVLPLNSGDTVLLMSDGFAELALRSGEQLGYGSVAEAFAAAARRGGDAASVISSLGASVREHLGDRAPDDDITFVVIRHREAEPA